MNDDTTPRAIAAEIIETWGADFPDSRFSGHPFDPRMSVKPEEAVDVVERGYLRGLVDARRAANASEQAAAAQERTRTTTDLQQARQRLTELANVCETRDTGDGVMETPRHVARQLGADLRVVLATTPGDDRGRELAEKVTQALGDPGAIVGARGDGHHIDRVIDWQARAALRVLAPFLAAPAETAVPTGSLLDAIGNAVYEAGVGRSGPDPTWHGVATAAERAARAWFARRAAPAETEAGDGVRALVDRDGHRWIELATDRWWCLPDPAEGVDSIIGPDEVVEPGRSRASVERTDGPVREVRLAATSPEPEGEAGSGTARRGLGDPYPIAQAIDGVTADLDASLSPRVDLVRVLLDVANAYVDRLIVEARTWTPPAPAGPQAEGAGETAGGAS